MKIAIIGPRVFPTSLKKGVGGLDIRAEQYIHTLSKKNILYVFIRKWTSQKKTSTSVNIFIIRIWTLKHILLDTFIYSFLATMAGMFYSCDIFMYESTGSASFSFLPKLLGKKIIVTIHAEEWKRSKWNIFAVKYLQFLEYISVHSATKVVTISSTLQTLIKNKYHVNSILIPYFQQKHITTEKSQLLHKLNLSENEFILFLGRITAEKRIEWIIQAYQEIKTNKKLVIAGDNFLDPQYVSFIKQLSNKNPNVIFTGHVIGDLKSELLQHCLFFVLPSIIEGQSIALLEAMSYHKPILVADIPPHSEMIQNKHFLFSQDNFADFQKKLTILLHLKKNEVRYSYLKILPSKKEFDSMYEKLIEDVEHP